MVFFGSTGPARSWDLDWACQKSIYNRFFVRCFVYLFVVEKVHNHLKKTENHHTTWHKRKNYVDSVKRQVFLRVCIFQQSLKEVVSFIDVDTYKSWMIKWK